MDFGTVIDGATEVRAVSFEAVTGATPVTLRANPPTGPFTLISPNEVTLQSNSTPQLVAFLLEHTPESPGEEGDFTVHGSGRSWNVRLRAKHTSYA